MGEEGSEGNGPWSRGLDSLPILNKLGSDGPLAWEGPRGPDTVNSLSTPFPQDPCSGPPTLGPAKRIGV
eukprot:1464165-Pyramimonas_sp.AAC.1